MKKFIKPQIKKIAISGIRQFDMKASYVDDVIKLTLGEVDFDTFDHIKKAISWAAENNKTHYTPNAGIDELRKKVSLRYPDYYNLENVIVTVGTTEGLSTIIKSIINPGDEVIIPTPGYVGYKPLVLIENGKVIEMDISKHNFKITRELLDECYSDKTKMLLLSNPNNPTGKILSDVEMDIIKEFVLEKDILLVSDELYSEIDYSNKFTSFAKFPSLYENVLILDGYSKSHAMSGFRIGYILGEPLMIKELLKTHQYSVTSATSLSQYAALAAKDTDAKEILAKLEKRRDFIKSQLDQHHISYIDPDGAFYILINISPFLKSSVAFCERLLFRYKVAAIPGSSFLGELNDYIRISYAIDFELLKEAMSRFFDFITELQNK
jgi:aminotransferase